MLNKLDVLSLTWTKILLTIEQTLAIVGTDFRKLKHDPYEIFMRMVQPVVWLVIFVESLSRTKALNTGAVPYIDFIAPGILAQSMLFISIFYGIALIWERDMGVLHKILVTPTPRAVLVIGRALAAGGRCLIQVFVIYLLSYILGIQLRLEFIPFLGVLLVVLMGGALFSTLSLIIASLVKKRERFMGIGQVLTMPLFFASNALYPLEIMPQWVKVVSKLNPLTYIVDAIRTMMIQGEASLFGLGKDFLIIGFAITVLIVIATKLYPKILY